MDGRFLKGLVFEVTVLPDGHRVIVREQRYKQRARKILTVESHDNATAGEALTAALGKLSARHLQREEE